MNMSKCGIMAFLCLSLVYCTTQPVKNEPAAEQPKQETIVKQEPPPAAEAPKDPIPPSNTVKTPSPGPEKKPDVIKTEDQTTEISHEEYAKTFEEVEKVIDELNSITKAGDFSRWTTYLSSKFTQEVMNPKALENINEQPLLKRNNITIKTLSDYFMYVVVPSRASVRLDDLIFTDTNRVRAFMQIRGDRVLIYQLEKINGKWKISTW